MEAILHKDGREHRDIKGTKPTRHKVELRLKSKWGSYCRQGLIHKEAHVPKRLTNITDGGEQQATKNFDRKEIDLEVG